MQANDAGEGLFNKQEKIVEPVGVFGMGGLVKLPQAEGLHEDLKASNVGGLLCEVRHKIPASDGPDREYAHRVQAAGRADQFIVLCGKQ